MKGYNTEQGYKGYVPEMGYILFCTEREYREYFEENFSDSIDRN